MRSAFVVILVAVLALAAGCVGKDDAHLETATAPEGDDDGPVTVPEAAPSTPEASAPAGTPRPEAVVVETPVQLEYAIGTGFVACDPNLPNGCIGESVVPGDSFVRLPFEGTVTGVDLVLTWSAQTPLTQTLGAVIAYGHETCGTDCIDVVDAIFVEGTSPLTVSTGDLASAGADIVYISVYEPRPDLPVSYSVSIEQTVSIEGTLRALVLDDPTAS